MIIDFGWSLVLLMFSVVPPSSNRTSKLNLDLRRKLQQSLFVELIEDTLSPQVGRYQFTPTSQTPSYAEWTTLLSTAMSVRYVVIELENVFTPNDTEATVAERIYARLQQQQHSTCKEALVKLYYAFDNILPNDRDPTFEITCRRWQDSTLAHLSTVAIAQQMRGVVATHFRGWLPHRSQVDVESADLQFHLVLRGTGCFLEMVLLVPTDKHQAGHVTLPKPGMKRVEAWMLVQSCGVIKDGDVVLDPFCGKGTFLIEAATMATRSTATRYIGVDQSVQQLADAQENVDATSTHQLIELHQGDATRLNFINDLSVNVILTCPPFGRQFDSGENHASLQNLYRECLVEWTRVCDRVLVIMIDVNNADTMIQAIQATGVWRLEVHREPFRLGRLEVTVLVTKRIFTKNPEDIPLPAKVLPWEGSKPLTRSGWTRIRAHALPSLAPYTSCR